MLDQRQVGVYLACKEVREGPKSNAVGFIRFKVKRRGLNPLYSVTDRSMDSELIEM